MARTAPLAPARDSVWEKSASRALPRVRSGHLALHLVVVVVCVFSAFPLLWMLSTAFKAPTEIFTSTPQLLPQAAMGSTGVSHEAWVRGLDCVAVDQ